MIRWIRAWFLTQSILVVAIECAAEDAQPSPSAQARAEQPADLERAKLLAEFEELQNAGKLDAAAGAAERILQADRKAIEPSQDDIIESLERLAHLCESQEDFAKAAAFLAQAAELARLAYAANDWRVADVDRELKHLERLKSLSADQRRQLVEADQLARRQALLVRQGTPREAVPISQQALESRRRVLGENDLACAELLSDIADVQQDAGNAEQAIALYTQALKIREATLGKDHPTCANTLRLLASVYQDEEKFDEARVLYSRSMAIYKATVGEKHADYAHAVMAFGNLNYAEGRYGEAKSYFRQALGIYELARGDQRLRCAQLKNNMANCLRGQGRYREACVYYLQSAEGITLAKGERYPDVVVVKGNLAGLYQQMGDYARSESLFLEALEVNRKAYGENDPRYANTLDGLGWLYNLQGNYTEAEGLLLQCLEIRRKTSGEKSSAYAITLNELGCVYLDRKENARAEKLFEQVVEIQQHIHGVEESSYATYLQNLALARDNQGKSREAEPLYLSALAIYQKTVGNDSLSRALTLNNLGFLYTHLGEHAKAEALYGQAADIYRRMVGEGHPEFARTMRNFGSLYDAQQKLADAEAHYQQAVQIEFTLLQATAVAQSDRQQLLMAEKTRDDLDAYLSFIVRSGRDPSSVYDDVLSWKGNVFTNQRALRVIASRPELAPVSEKLRGVTERLAHLAFDPSGTHQTDEPQQQQIADLNAEKETLERELSRRSQAFRESRKPFDDVVLRLALPAGAVLIDYFEYDHTTLPPAGSPGKEQTERRLVAFVVRKSAPVELVALGPVQEIAAAVDQWRKDYGATATSEQAGRVLRKRLWEPLEAKLHGAKFVLISPDGSLGMLPLAALPGKVEGTYLLEDWALAVVPVPQAIPVLLRDDERPRPAGNLLLLGGIDYDAQTTLAQANKPKKVFGALREIRGADGGAFAPLEATKGEIAGLEKMYRDNFGADGIEVLEAGRASETAFRQRAPNFLFLHLATHGFFAPPAARSALAGGTRGDQTVPENLDARGAFRGYSPGLLSGLALAGANRPGSDADDGILTAEEVGTLDLSKVDLTVLSACETGLGQVAGGEGILGLQRAFQVAGARTVVASLWKVSDRETRDLMEQFYSNIWNKDMDKLSAMRDAQLWMLRTGPKRDIRLRPQATEPKERAKAPPYYWAAFVLSGDWR